MKRIRLMVLSAVVLGGLVWWLAGEDGGAARSGGADESRRMERDRTDALRRNGMKSADPAEIRDVLGNAVTVLRGGNREERDRLLAVLDGLLAGGGGNAARIAAIVEFLRSGEDAATGMGFVIGSGGVLEEATTLRVYLMDRLGRLSRGEDASAALEVARQTLGGFGSADEWAISMRNMAWLDGESDAFLKERVLALLGHEPWREAPTAGMLESFDVIVHTGALEAVPELDRLLVTPGSPLARAAAVALDRLAGRRPLDFATLLNQRPETLAAVPLVRADLFARGDLGVPEQRGQLEAYLLRADVEAEERGKFFGALIQTGRFVSHNLITPYVPPETPEEAGARLDLLTRTVNDWLRDSRFAAIRGEIAGLGETVNGILDEMAADESR
jgi:hypothetical protein